MAAYTSGDYVYFNNMNDIPNKHHIGFILNQIHDIYITSPLKLWIKHFNHFQTYLLIKLLKNG